MMRLQSLSGPLKLAGAGAALLFITLFFPWYGTDTEGLGIDATASAWQAFSLIDIILFLCAAAVAALLVREASDEGLPVPLATLITGIGALALLLIFYRFLDTPFDLDRRYGLFLGFAAAAGVTIGGWLAMKEAGESFAGARNEIGSRVDQARVEAADTIGGDARRLEEMSRDELYEEAQQRGIEGRSEMSKQELITALRRAG